MTNEDKRIAGKITKLSGSGWGFITSMEIEFTRIFFHWSALNQDTLNYKELKLGMKVEFTPIMLQDKGYRAVRIKVLVDKSTTESTEQPDDLQG